MSGPSSGVRTPETRPRLALVVPGARSDPETWDYTEAQRRGLAALADAQIIGPHQVAALPGETYCLYHLKNHSGFADTYTAALARPGLVVLHEAVLHHVLLASLPEERYVEEFVFSHGEWLRPRAIEMRRKWEAEEPDPRSLEYPMLRRLVETSRGIVVHNRTALRLARGTGVFSSASARFFEIPRWIELPEAVPEEEAARFRHQHDIPPDAIVISCFGPFRPETRLRSVLEAAAALSAPCRILLAGDFDSREFESSLEPFLKDLPVIQLGRPTGPELWRCLQAADIGVRLSSPSTGHSPPEIFGWMALGKPVLLTADEAADEFPAGSIVPIDPGDAEMEMLAHYLHALATDPGLRSGIGELARQHAYEHHRLEAVAPLYMQAIEDLAPAGPVP